MEQLIWKSLQETDSAEIYEILRLRTEVFILEQRCIYPECDEWDGIALHLQYLLNGKLTGYLRLIPKDEGEYTVGRVVVRIEQRRKGIGQKLLAEAASLAQKLGAKRLTLNAQLRYRTTYEKAGYTLASSPFDEEGILHVQMVKTIDKI